MALATAKQFARISEACDALLYAMDLLRLTPRDIRDLARALSQLPKGQSFAVTIKTTSGKPFERTVIVEYGD